VTDGPIEVMLVSAQRLFLDALQSMLPLDCAPLEADIEVVGIATSVPEAIEMAKMSRRPAFVLDIDASDKHGVDALVGVFSAFPAAPVAAITERYDAALMELLLAHGAGGYVLRSDRGAELGRAIRVIARGGMFLSTSVSGMRAASRRAHDPGNGAPRFDSLGPRERQVLALIAEGQRSKQIAAELRVSVATVDVHRRNIMRKLDLHSVAQLTKYAIRERLIPLEIAGIVGRSTTQLR